MTEQLPAGYFPYTVVLTYNTPAERRERDHHERVHEVIRVLHEGATEMAWSTRYDVDDGLTWDAKREVWVGSDGFAYDGTRLFEYSRGGGVRT